MFISSLKNLAVCGGCFVCIACSSYGSNYTTDYSRIKTESGYAVENKVDDYLTRKAYSNSLITVVSGNQKYTIGTGRTYTPQKKPSSNYYPALTPQPQVLVNNNTDWRNDYYYMY